MKHFNIFLKLSVIILILTNSLSIFAQPFRVEGDFGSGWSNFDLADRGLVRAVRLQASTSNTAAGFLFNNPSLSYDPKWNDANSDGAARAINTRLANGAEYSTGGAGQDLTVNITNSYYYTFIVAENSGASNDMSILETSYNPVTISSVTQTPAAPDNTESATITATLSGTLNTGEYAFIRYTTDAWASSTLISMSLTSGTDYEGTIPAQSTGVTVEYYVLTSNDNTFSSWDSDYFTLEYDNNSSSNYSYTVTCNIPAEPTTEATNLTFSSVKPTTMTLSWTDGDGANRIVVAKAGSAITGSPADASGYAADAAFGNGATIAADEYVVYNGSGSTVDITDLSDNTTYYFAIFEYNGVGCPTSEENYLTGSPLTGSQATPIALYAAWDNSRQDASASYYLGDKFKISFDINGNGWTSDYKQAGWGQTNTAAALTWNTVTWADDADDGVGNNEGVEYEYQATALGTWYYSLWLGNDDGGSDDDAVGGDYGLYFNNNTSWNDGSKTFISSNITVSDLGDPTLGTVQKDATYGASKVELNWTRWDTRDVIIVRSEDATFTAPTNTTLYNAGDALGDDLVIYRGALETFTDGENNDLIPGNTYYYKIYTENWTYYSAGVTTAGITLDDVPQPTTCTATTISDTQIDLNWTRDAVYDNVIVVVRLGATPDDLTQGTTYNQGDGDENTSAGYILYKGNIDYSSTAYNHTALSSASTYYYKYFTVVNDSYYSVTDVNTEKNATTNAPAGKISVSDGLWSDANIWSPTGVPVSTDAVTINTDVTLDQNGDVLDIIINSGKTLTSEDGNARVLTIASGGKFENKGTFTANDGTVILSGTATIEGTQSTAFNNITINDATTINIIPDINGTLSLNSGGYLSSNSVHYNEGSTLKYFGAYTINSGDQSWFSNTPSSGTAQTGIPWNVEIDASGTVSLNDNTPFAINGDITINGTFNINTTAGADFFLRGNFTNNGTFNHNNGKVTLNGTNTQTIGGTASPVFDFLELNNPAGAELSFNTSTETNLIFTSGKINLKNFNLNTGTGTITGYDNTKYIIAEQAGYLIRNVGTTEVCFPVGTNTDYAPAYLTQNGTQEDLYVRVKEGIDNPTNNNDFAVNLQWTVDESIADSNTITAKFQWNASNEGIYFNKDNSVKIAYFDAAYKKADAVIGGTDPYDATRGSLIKAAGTQFIVANDFCFVPNAFYTVQNGDWNTGTTWNGGVIPSSSATCQLLHHVTLSGTATNNNFSKINIITGKSFTLDNAASVITTDSIINYGTVKSTDGGTNLNINNLIDNKSGASVNMVGGGNIIFANNAIFTNDGSFTSGTSTVTFTGNGTASGTLVFNNLNISGGNVDLGTSASLNGTLTLSGTGDLITNNISYTTGSVLKFDRDYSLTTNKIWEGNVVASGNAQQGIPWDVEIAAAKTVDIGDAAYRAINGSITIDGTFELSTSAGGDFKLRGDFTNNGTFTHNNRYVEFDGANSQTITGTPQFQDIIINNNANVTLNSSIIVANNLNFAAGKVILGDNNISLQSGATISNADASKYVVTNGNGYLIQNIAVSSSVFYPVGSLSGYNPANLSQGGSATADNIAVRFQASVDNAVNDPTQTVNAQWTIDEATAGGNDLTTQFYWNLTDEAGSFDRTGGTSNVETRYYSGGYLPNPPSASTVNGTNPYDATSNAADVYTGNLSNLQFIVANNGAFSNGIITVADGNWSDGSIWNTGTAPASGQAAVIKHNVILDISPTVKSVSIDNIGTLSCGSNTITLENGGAIANTNDANFDAGTGTVVFSGSGTISTGAITFNNVELNGAVSFGSNTKIGGTLSLNSGSFINTNPPIYQAGSTLKYNSGGNYNRSAEWQYNIAEGDPGYPANVQISNNTILDVDADAYDEDYYNTRFLSGNLIIDSGSEISLGDMGGGITEDKICGVYAKGNIINNGTITLSSSFGGDIMLEGDIINTGTINWNGRAIFFTGANNVNQNITGIAQIPYILMTRGANVILNNNLEVNGTGDEFITFARPSSTNTGSIDLNNYTLTCSGDGNIELNDISGAEVTGTGRVEVTGGNATYSGIGSGTLSFGDNVTLAINGGTMTFPSTLGIVTVFGTLEIGDNASITNIPTYGTASTLHYVKSDPFIIGDEWGAGSNSADNIPFNVTVGQGATPGTLTMNKERYALGTLKIENGGTLNVAPAVGLLQVNNLTVDAGGKIVIQSPDNMTAGGSLITTGTVTNNGTMIAERYLTGNEYRYVSSPNNTSTGEVFTNAHSSGYFNQNFIKYNESYDKSPDPTSNNYSEWTSLSDAWEHAHGGDGNPEVMNPGQGYAFYTDENLKYEYDGTFNSADQDIAISFTDNDGNSGYFDGWNFIGNPYPTTLDWESVAWDKTNIENTAYFWNGTNYQYFNGTTGTAGTMTDDGTDAVNGATRYIPAMQGFFVKAVDQSVTGDASSDAYTLTIPKDARLHNGSQNFWRNSSKAPQETVVEYLKLSVSANGYTDETLIRTKSDATNNYDTQYDASKMYSPVPEVPQIFSYNTEKNMAINTLPEITNTTVIPLGFEIAKKGRTNAIINAKSMNLANKHAYLKDLYEDVTQNLTNNSAYYFSVSDSTELKDRFEIVFTDNTAPVAHGIANQTTIYGSLFEFGIPEGAFTDEDAGDKLKYSVTLDTRNNLPEGLIFDNKTQTISGIPTQAGTYTISVKATDLLNAESTQTFTLTIEKAELAVEADNLSRDYGEENPALTYQTTGFVLDDNATDIDILPTAETTANTSSLAGTYPISLSGASDDNYQFTYTDGTLTVNTILPAVQTLQVNDISDYSANISGKVTSHGGSGTLTAGVCWNTIGTPDISDNTKQITTSEGDYDIDLTGLNANTTYYARTYAENSKGITYGDEINFTTQQAVSVENIKDMLSISPNPTKGKLNIILNTEFKTDIKYTLSNISGKIILENTLNKQTNEIDLSTFAKGMYFIKIKINNTIYTEQIILE